ncbi:unnamed protein product [Dicrocoelium dendriticum]|nr:unnamed protein product [Dicrocoelium dendriticum]
MRCNARRVADMLCCPSFKYQLRKPRLDFSPQYSREVKIAHKEEARPAHVASGMRLPIDFAGCDELHPQTIHPVLYGSSTIAARTDHLRCGRCASLPYNEHRMHTASIV